MSSYSNNDLITEISIKLTEIEGVEHIPEEQLVKCLGMMTGFMMLELKIAAVETDELELAVKRFEQEQNNDS